MPTPTPSLTLRQQALLGLLCLGATDAQICRVLHVERPWLYRQMHRLRQVVGCQTREELVAWVQHVPRPQALDPVVQALEGQALRTLLPHP